MLTSSRKSPHTISRHGFTIVELLIVIIVIAILASITVIAYNGVRQRANNAAVIDAASKSMRMIEAYIAANGTYPDTTSDVCITVTSGCVTDNAVTVNGSSTFTTNIAKIGSVPVSVPNSGAVGNGVSFTYNTSQTLSGVTQPLRLTYFLAGVNQSCGLSVTSFTWPSFTPSTTGYTSGNIQGIGKTLCWVSIPGPTS